MAWQMMAAQGAMNIIGSFGAMGQAKATSAAARQQALNEVDRLHREMDQVRDQYRGAKDDRAREADYQMGALMAAMADNGGAGTLNASRMAGEVSFFEGLDVARLETNRKQHINSLKSQQVAANQNALNIQGQAWKGAMSSWMNVGKAAASSYLNYKNTTGAATQTQTPKPMNTPIVRNMWDADDLGIAGMWGE